MTVKGLSIKEQVTPPEKPLTVAVYSYNNPEDACGYVRLQSPLLASCRYVKGVWGVHHKRCSFVRWTSIDEDLIDTADIIVVQRTFPRKRTQRFLRRILASRKPFIYEIDDLLTDIPADNSYAKAAIRNKEYLLDFISNSHAVTVSTECLKEALLKYNKNTYVLPNLLDENLWACNDRKINPGPVVIGFAGGKSHKKDLQMIEDALLTVARNYGENVAFRFIGCVTEKLARLPNSQFIPFTSTYENYASFLQASAIDIGLAPLEENSFNRCKSNIKWLEYSACGIAGVYSDLSPYNGCVAQGETGVLAGSNPDSWADAIRFLLEDSERRARIASRAKEEALSKFSLRSGPTRLADLYQKIVNEVAILPATSR